MSTRDKSAGRKKRSGDALAEMDETRDGAHTNVGIGIRGEPTPRGSDPLTVEIARQRQEAELREAKEETEFYLDLLSHDVRNLIQIGVGYIELAQQSPDTEEVKSLMARALGIMHDTAQIIDNVQKLQVLRQENADRKPVNLYEVLSDLQSRYMTSETRKVTVNLYAIPPCHVLASELVTDVFSNLIHNSIKHSNPEKPLTINIRVDQVRENSVDYRQCTVDDNGPGISNWAKNQIFIRFQQGDATAHGKGLGLHIARTLVEDYGGKMWVEDRVPGDYSQGARFVVVLPAA